MNSDRTYRLIDGTFSAAEASDVLLSLVKSKMDFHQLQKASNEERFGVDLHHSGSRLIELRKLQEQLQTLCQTAREAGHDLKVRGWIEITQVSPDSQISETTTPAITSSGTRFS